MDTIFTNARIVTPEAVVSGTLVARDGHIAAIEDGPSRAASAIDLEGDHLLPGLVELHTDNVEKHFGPRPGVRWPGVAAMVAHDMQVSAAGITTVFDAIAVGEVFQGTARLRNMQGMVDALHEGLAAGVLRSDHYLHMRLEVSQPNVIDLFRPFLDDARVRLVSLMDHTPGQRQFVHEAKYREYYQGRYALGGEDMDRFIAHKKELAATYSDRHRRTLVALCRDKGWPLATHDDATLAHVEEAVAQGMVLSEFPTTVTAADAAHAAGLKVIAGAPNLVRGESHSGNVSVAELAARSVVDILSSDYYPQSLLHGAFRLTDPPIGLALPAAVATVTATPAAAVGLDDRGRIAPGMRADLIRVRRVGDLPVVRATWRGAARIA